MSASDALAAANANQRAAADPDASVFVTANAGSGKTKVLVDRIARLLLLEGARPSAFLCITYTKAAATEMQRRLFERLGAWCVASDEALSADLMALAGPGAPIPNTENLARARALFARALETPGGLKIQTIHAFCERLLARFPIEAGVAPGFDIADDARAAAILQQARADSVLDAAGHSAAAFERFAARMGGEALEALLDTLAARRTAFAAFECDAGAIRARHGVTGDLAHFVASFAARMNWERLRDARTALHASSPADQRIAARIERTLSAFDRGDMEAAARACADCAFNEKGERYKNAVTKAAAAQHPWLQQAVDEFGALGAEACDALNAIDRAEDCVALKALATRLDRAYEAAKNAHGVLDFDDLIAHARRLLSRADAAPWVLYKLDGGIDHILIDEGQDTSPAQWDVVAPLQDEFFSGAGAMERARTVFAVGDPKQSIYAFQGADPQRFLSETRALEARARAASRTFKAPALETSFRSAAEILRAVDLTMAQLDLAPGAPEGQNIPRHLASRAGEPGMVEVWPLVMRPAREPARPWDAPIDVESQTSAPALLARALARAAKGWIRDRHAVWDKGALRPMHAGDILVLVKKRGALFRELIRAFKREGLPVAGADRMVLSEELAVEDCLALMRVALDPNDDYALACVLKGPWCNLDDDDADLFPLAHARAGSLRDALMAYPDEKYAPARAFISELTVRAHLGAFAFLSWALETPHGGGATGWARVFARLGMETRDPLEELLARALKPAAHVAPSLQRFVHDIESDAGQVKREMEAAGENVRVMTVHGSKGLEAPVVILPDTTSPVSERAESGLVFGPDGPFMLLSKDKDDTATRSARALHGAGALGEHWRLLYVAMTRARDRLIVCGVQHGGAKTGEGDTSWRRVVETALAEVAETIETPTGPGLRLGAPAFADPASAAARVDVTAPDWAMRPAPNARAMESAAPSRLKALDAAVFSPRGDGHARFRRGRLIHGLLERLPDVAPERRAAAAREWLQRQRASDVEVEAFAREALAVIEDARFSDAFGALSRAEAPIIGEVAGKAVRGVVDRLAVGEKNVLIVDFKTDRPAPRDPRDAPESYVLQMALYRAVISRIFPSRDVRCALIWTEAPHLMELEIAQMEAQLAAFAGG